jgi:hypothetical protein
LRLRRTISSSGEKAHHPLAQYLNVENHGGNVSAHVAVAAAAAVAGANVAGNPMRTMSMAPTKLSEPTTAKFSGKAYVALFVRCVRDRFVVVDMLSLEALAMLSCVGDIAASQLMDDLHRSARNNNHRQKRSALSTQVRAAVLEDDVDADDEYDDDDELTTSSTADDSTTQYDADAEGNDESNGDNAFEAVRDDDDDEEEEDIDPLDNSEDARLHSYASMRNAVRVNRLHKSSRC